MALFGRCCCNNVGSETTEPETVECCSCSGLNFVQPALLPTYTCALVMTLSNPITEFFNSIPRTLTVPCPTNSDSTLPFVVSCVATQPATPSLSIISTIGPDPEVPGNVLYQMLVTIPLIVCFTDACGVVHYEESSTTVQTTWSSPPNTVAIAPSVLAEVELSGRCPCQMVCCCSGQTLHLNVLLNIRTTLFLPQPQLFQIPVGPECDIRRVHTTPICPFVDSVESNTVT